MTCKACTEKRQHTAEEWRNHPLAGHGYTPESGATFPHGSWTYIGVSVSSGDSGVSLHIDNTAK